MPLVSIIIPTLNCEAVLDQCLAAIRNSTFKDYEIIVVDGQSADRTQEIARHYADKLLIPSVNRERGDARNQGINAAEGRILVFLDADNVVRHDSLERIVAYMRQHPEVDAVNGLIAAEHPNGDFFSQYKNLYMHFNFRRLPENITFLHGSLYAVKKESVALGTQPTITDDTDRGQRLFLQKKKIVLLHDLEVIHLKKYSLWGFVKNDFIVPYSWSCLFLEHRGWRQLGKHGTGYAHASMGQLLSVILAPLIAMLSVLAVFKGVSAGIPAGLLLVWFFLNLRFLVFLTSERGAYFGIRSVLVTYLDGIIMFLGIAFGFLRWMPMAVRKGIGIGNEGA